MDNSFLHSKRLLLVDDEQELLKMVWCGIKKVDSLFSRIS